MHYYKFNIGDYHSHTSHLDPIEDITYRRLMDWYYLHETPIPLDFEVVARKIRMRTHCDCIANVLQEFFKRTPNGWIQERADKEIEAFKAKSDKASKSAKARWDKPEVDANALRTQSKGNAKHKTLNTKQETKDITHTHTASGFDEIKIPNATKKHKKCALPFTDLPVEWIEKTDQIWHDHCAPPMIKNDVFRDFKNDAVSKGKESSFWFGNWQTWIIDPVTIRRHGLG